ncbi:MULTISPECIES: hypothetical protein [unclassified Neisseria]|uniref:hypothetical protein n=1 Tax=unclassified Neisseria TaxID=2623750 RepID=UPI001430093C|nr:MULTISPECIES: hypothetical protein [unclassified Neisseria]MBF0803192.1 hypothetical protein [Neisseria sp. 19428wB4_WF04]
MTCLKKHFRRLPEPLCRNIQSTQNQREQLFQTAETAAFETLKACFRRPEIAAI